MGRIKNRTFALDADAMASLLSALRPQRLDGAVGIQIRRTSRLGARTTP